MRPRPNPVFWRFMGYFQRACNRRSYRDGVQALSRLNAHTLNLYDEMAADGVSFEMHARGLLFFFWSEAGAQEMARSLSAMQLRGHPAARALEVQELRAEGIDIADGVIGGMLVPEQRHVRPESVIGGLARRLGELGVPVRSNERVQAIERVGGQVGGVCTMRETLSSQSTCR